MLLLLSAFADTGVAFDPAPPPQEDQDFDGWPIGEDCNDEDPSVHPGAPDVCDGVDNDCDGDVDEVDTGVFYLWFDADHDGFGVYQEEFVDPPMCPLPVGYSGGGGDCDDTNPAFHPGALDDQCDGIDQDCDGLPDDGHPTAGNWGPDEDGDGYAFSVIFGCQPHGWVSEGGDCDDQNSARYLGAEDVPGDGIDQDCDGMDAPFPDEDGDGYDTETDCDDQTVGVNPGADESCGNGIDDNCDERVDENCETEIEPDHDKSCRTAGTLGLWFIRR